MPTPFLFRILASTVVVGWLSLGSALAVAPEDLPTKAQELRDAGLDADQVRAALKAAQEAGLAAEAAATLLADAVEPVVEHGPVDDFGVFVKTQLDAGLRGPELAGIIQAEHANRGLGNDPKPKPKPAPTRPDPAPSRPSPAPVRPTPAPPRPAPARPTPAPQPSPAPPKSKFRPKGGR